MRLFWKKNYPDDDAEVEGLIDETGWSPVLWTLGEEGVEDSGVAISSMSAYGPVGLEPFLLKALLKELRSWIGKKINWITISWISRCDS